MSRSRFVTKAGGFALRAIFARYQKLNALQAERKGERLGALAYRVSKKHRERAISNLRLAFPEWDDAQVEKTALEVMKHFGRVSVEFARSKSRSLTEVLESVVEVQGWEHLQPCLDSNSGVFCISGHFGAWERLADWLQAKGFRVAVIVRAADDPDLEAIVLDVRQAHGVQVMHRGNAIRQAMSHAKKGGLVGLLPDQNSSEIFVPFFGHPCGTVKGPAVLTIRTGVPLVPIYMYRVGPGKYRIVVEPPLQPIEGFEPEEGLTRAANLSLENAIRLAPEQYLWIHNRWKSARQRGLVP